MKAYYYYQPLNTNENAWNPQQLEYQFECSAPTTSEVKTIKAEEYYQGHLDWPAFDIDRANLGWFYQTKQI